MKTLPCHHCCRAILIDDLDYLGVSKHRWSCQSGMHMVGTGEWTPLGNFILGVSGIVDHADRDTHNNQRRNLRQATKSQNNHNMDIRKDNTTGYKGIQYTGYKLRPYRMQIRKDGKVFTRDCQTLKDAVLTYNKKAKELYGEFAYQNTLKV